MSLADFCSLALKRANGLIHVVSVLVIGLVTAYLLIYNKRERHNAGLSRQAMTHTTERGNSQAEWRPRKFEYPRITPVKKPISQVKSAAYRPFREGPYHVTMGIRSMPFDEWIEVDEEFEHYSRIRQHRMRTRDCIRVMPATEAGINGGVTVRGGGLAAIELVHEIAQFLAARYPFSYTIERLEIDQVDRNTAMGFWDWGWGEALPVKTITITDLPGATYELPLHVDDGPRAPERALEIAAQLVQDDLALMIEGSDGRYYLQAGAIVVPGTWRIKDKIGLPLDEIHTAGEVPRYREKLQGSMERFFKRLAVEKPVVRQNYLVQVVPKDGGEEADPEELGWSTRAMGAEDEDSQSQVVMESLDEPGIEQIRLRAERQSLRRLGVSGAIVFTIRTYMVSFDQLGREEGVAGRLASALREWPEDVKGYKGVQRGNWWNVVLDYLDHKTREQGGVMGPVTAD